MPSDSDTTHLAPVGVLAGFDSDELSQFSRFGKALEVESRELIIRQGESHDCLYIVLKGKVRVYRRSAAGFEVTLAELVAGDVLGDMNFLDHQPAIATGQAFGGASLWRMNREEFDRFVTNHPHSANKLVTELAVTIVRRLRRAVRQMTDHGQAVGEGWW